MVHTITNKRNIVLITNLLKQDNAGNPDAQRQTEIKNQATTYQSDFKRN